MSKLDELENLADAANRDIEGSMVIDPQTIKEMISLIRQCKEAIEYCEIHLPNCALAKEALAAIKTWEKP